MYTLVFPVHSVDQLRINCSIPQLQDFLFNQKVSVSLHLALEEQETAKLELPIILHVMTSKEEGHGTHQIPCSIRKSQSVNLL